jgi:hypothetical protein
LLRFHFPTTTTKKSLKKILKSEKNTKPLAYKTKTNKKQTRKKEEEITFFPQYTLIYFSPLPSTNSN